ncbi:MAG: 16S rRNA (uracil(1498)-N(3))-methyltransferase [Holosporaceae bacterium]|jgi:16S rRNA (uracil1498-N3)-methyltransferase|nr:16S rRNA (uracil(1498)-N(3))-methyltransferase [Holosporaceae bacterium]
MKHIPRFYVETELTTGRETRLSPDQAHHAVGALRLSVGSVVRAFNARFGEWNCEIIDAKKGLIKCVSLFRKAAVEKKGPTIACSLINPKRFDLLLEKGTELGVAEIIPIISDYTQYRNMNVQKAKQKITQACEQCGRLDIPILQNPLSLRNFLVNYENNCTVLVGDERFLGDKLEDVIEENCVFLVGPEGGFSDEEHNLFDAYKNVIKFSVGKNILKSETAAIVFISVWIYRFF